MTLFQKRVQVFPCFFVSVVLGLDVVEAAIWVGNGAREYQRTSLVLTALGQFVAELLDLAAVGVVEVVNALLSMRAFKLHICPRGVAFSGQDCQVTAQISCSLTDTIQIHTGSRKLALQFLDRSLAAVCTFRFRLGTALGRTGTPFRLGPGLLLSLTPPDRRIKLLLELPQLHPCSLNVLPERRRVGRGLLPVGRRRCLNLGQLGGELIPALPCGVQLGLENSKILGQFLTFPGCLLGRSIRLVPVSLSPALSLFRTAGPGVRAGDLLGGFACYRLDLRLCGLGVTHCAKLAQKCRELLPEVLDHAGHLPTNLTCSLTSGIHRTALHQVAASGGLLSRPPCSRPVMARVIAILGRPAGTALRSHRGTTASRVTAGALFDDVLAHKPHGTVFCCVTKYETKQNTKHETPYGPTWGSPNGATLGAPSRLDQLNTAA